MKVSIIIPVYNVEPYIERCLLSVYNQTYNHLEVIIVDDCSTDNSMEIARKVSAPYESRFEIKYISLKENSGVSIARNTGIDIASGEYIFFIDPDDSLTERCIELLVNCTHDYRYDFIASSYDLIGEHKNIKFEFEFCSKNDVVLDNKELQELYYKSKGFVMVWNRLFNRKFIISNNLYFHKGIIHQDVLWSFMMINKARSMRIFRDEVTYHYFVRENSAMTSLKLENGNRCKKIVITEMMKYIHSHMDSVYPSVHQYIERRKLVLFRANRIKVVGLKKAYEIFKFIWSNPSLDPSAITPEQRRLNSCSKLPPLLGYIYYIAMYRYNKLTAK